MTTFAETLAADRRLSVLLLLERAGSANDALLQSALDEFGHRSSADQVRADLAWLAEQGLLETRVIPGGLTIATINTRGEDVATGRATIPGVKRPRRQ